MGRDWEAERMNLGFWDEVAPVHRRSYDLDPLYRRGHLLDPVQVRELGCLRGKRVLHLQCHIGTDTLSLARLGAQVTGVDFSGESVRIAGELSRETGIPARFIRASLYDLPSILDERFDLVYTSIGVLCWLSDLNGWARVVSSFIEPEGSFYLMESHPLLQVYDDESQGLSVRHPYFTGGVSTEWPGDCPDYSDPEYIVKHPTREFTWTLSDMVNGLIRAGLAIRFINEHDFLHWRALPCMVRGEDGYWRLPEPLNRIPLLLSLGAAKPREG